MMDTFLKKTPQLATTNTRKNLKNLNIPIFSIDIEFFSPQINSTKLLEKNNAKPT